MVELSVVKKEQQNCILISMVNSCDMAPIKDANGNFETGKDKSKGHGYGTKSIARVIQKYNGEADMRYDEIKKQGKRRIITEPLISSFVFVHSIKEQINGMIIFANVMFPQQFINVYWEERFKSKQKIVYVNTAEQNM